MIWKTNRVIGFWFVLVSLLGACHEEGIRPVEESIAVPEQEAETVWPGMVNLKFTPELAARLNVPTRSQGETCTGNTELDQVTATLGKVRFVRVFPPAGKYEARHRKAGLDRWYRIECEDTVDIQAAIAAYRNIPGVEYVGPVHRPQRIQQEILPAPIGEVIGECKPMATDFPFNDPGLPLQWHYDRGNTEVAPEAGIGLFKAWQVTAGSPEVIVAVIDIGVNYNHEDLRDQMWVNEQEKDGKYNADDDGNGFKDDVYGYNFYQNRGNIQPGDHGTHIAGTIGATNGNGIGVCGIAGGTGHHDGVRIMTCQIADELGVSLSPNLVAAFPYAADNGAVIAQCSWNINASYDEALADAIHYFTTYAGCDENGNQIGPMKGGVVFVACGNDKQELKRYPASSEEVVAVAGLNHLNLRGDYSNYGSWVDLSAPGGSGSKYESKYGVYSTMASGYGYMSGTSMACPHVSGIAALVVSLKKGPGFTNEQLKEILFESTVPLENEPLRDKMGIGGLRADLALWRDDKIAPAKVTDLRVEQDEELNFRLRWTIATDPNDKQPKTYTVYYGTTPGNGTNWQHETIVPVEGQAGESMTFALPEKKSLYFAVVGTDIWGNRSDLSNVVEFQWKDDVKAPAAVETLTLRTVDGVNYLCWEQVSDPGDGLPALYIISWKNRQGETGNRKVVATGQQAGEEIRYDLSGLPGDIEDYTFSVVAVDKWGNRSEPSAEVSAVVTGDRDFVAYPLPMQGKLTLQWGKELSGEKKITLYDVSGRAIWHYTLTETRAPGREVLTLPGIAAGLYSLEMKANGIRVRKQVLSL